MDAAFDDLPHPTRHALLPGELTRNSLQQAVQHSSQAFHGQVWCDNFPTPHKAAEADFMDLHGITALDCLGYSVSHPLDLALPVWQPTCDRQAAIQATSLPPLDCHSGQQGLPIPNLPLSLAGDRRPMLPSHCTQVPLNPQSPFPEDGGLRSPAEPGESILPRPKRSFALATRRPATQHTLPARACPEQLLGWWAGWVGGLRDNRPFDVKWRVHEEADISQH